MVLDPQTTEKLNTNTVSDNVFMHRRGLSQLRLEKHLFIFLKLEFVLPCYSSVRSTPACVSDIHSS